MRAMLEWRVATVPQGKSRHRREMSADGSKYLKGEVADEAEVPMLPATPIPALAGIFCLESSLVGRNGVVCRPAAFGKRQAEPDIISTDFVLGRFAPDLGATKLACRRRNQPALSPHGNQRLRTVDPRFSWLACFNRLAGARISAVPGIWQPHSPIAQQRTSR